ncbi:MAG: UDP-N-acetylglucosamine 2-epimerase (non-hydrolyzing) [Crocinitomicaceae bacterium]|nr:UDP-N-acetylglucosamine 2-epimerase (non-hydrolyzing) [Crocinitomicaceae bacterium]|tara:strand:+ start:1118 stop:2260 length:1143 start_codon:yes stop_codon:yes gene_type:complete
MKIITIVGARPQIIKAAAFSRAISLKFPEIEEVIVHTGQHYDDNMSEVFFKELGIPNPAINLHVGSSSHGNQTALMIQKIEEILLKENPNAVLVYGDTNSTLATAIAASKIHVPIVHVEAGLRSFNKKMPEEINRVLCDHSSTLLFSPTKSGFKNLIKEGFKPDIHSKADMDHPNIYHCGDVMYDNSIYFSELSDKNSTIVDDLNLKKNNYILSTVHRNDNTDNSINLNAIFSSFIKITEQHEIKLILPLHPRTSKMMDLLLKDDLKQKIKTSSFISIVPPASFLDILALEKNAKIIITDSGGLQKEAYFFKKPCIILRPQTEWVEILETGSAIISDANEQAILDGVNSFFSKNNLTFPPIFGDGHAAEFIAKEILKQLK